MKRQFEAKKYNLKVNLEKFLEYLKIQQSLQSERLTQIIIYVKEYV